MAMNCTNVFSQFLDSVEHITVYPPVVPSSVRRLGRALRKTQWSGGVRWWNPVALLWLRASWSSGWSFPSQTSLWPHAAHICPCSCSFCLHAKNNESASRMASMLYTFVNVLQKANLSWPYRYHICHTNARALEGNPNFKSFCGRNSKLYHTGLNPGTLH